MPRTDALDLFLVGRSLIRETEQLRRLALAMIRPDPGLDLESLGTTGTSETVGTALAWSGA